MSPSLRDRLAYWLERKPWAWPLLFADHGRTTHTNRPMLRNRLNGHVVVL